MVVWYCGGELPLSAVLSMNYQPFAYHSLSCLIIVIQPPEWLIMIYNYIFNITITVFGINDSCLDVFKIIPSRGTLLLAKTHRTSSHE